jgi:mono-ADP-ribosyltransferase sirtuin 6
MGSCPGKLKDTLLDWEDMLPQTEWNRAQEECSRANLVLCLGTSLRIEPAGSLCELPLAKNAPWSLPEVSVGGKKAIGTKRKERSAKETKLGYAIVNLQPTPYDDGAAIVIRGKVDDVMRSLMEKLGYGPWDERDLGEGIAASLSPTKTYD